MGFFSWVMQLVMALTVVLGMGLMTATVFMIDSHKKREEVRETNGEHGYIYLH